MPKSNKAPKGIYADYASSATPNPSAIHALGVETRAKIEDSRNSVASILGAGKGEVVFTGSGTEGNNLAIQGLVGRWTSEFQKSGVRKIPHIVTTNIEHPSVLETCQMLERRGLAEVTFVPVESNGIVDPKKIKKELKENTILVSVMYANNEIGTIQPIKEIAKEVRHFRKLKQKNFSQAHLRTPFPFFHTDAVQAVNYLDLNVDRLGVDMLTLSGAKIEGAEPGVGVLYKKRNVPLANIFGGGGQESGLRPGTENAKLISSFTKAFARAQKEKEKETKRLVTLRDFFIKELKKKYKGLVVNGDLVNRLPNNVNMTFPKIPSDLMLLELSARSIFLSEKSACKSGEEKNSYVIEAIRMAEHGNVHNAESLRFSFGSETTKNQIKTIISAIDSIYKKLGKWYN